MPGYETHSLGANYGAITSGKSRRSRYETSPASRGEYLAEPPDVLTIRDVLRQIWRRHSAESVTARSIEDSFVTELVVHRFGQDSPIVATVLGTATASIVRDELRASDHTVLVLGANKGATHTHPAWPHTLAPADRRPRIDFLVVVDCRARRVEKVICGPDRNNLADASPMRALLMSRMETLAREYPHPSFDIIIGLGDLASIRSEFGVFTGWREAVVESLTAS